MHRGDDSSASQRWQRLVSARREEMQRMSPDSGLPDRKFWDKRAERYDANMKGVDIGADPLLRRLRRLATPSSTVLDVGAGTGRFALALAPDVAHVTLVDPSDGMLAVARQRADSLGVTNVTTVHAAWKDAHVGPADIAFSSYVLPLVPDARPFLEKLDAMARRHAVLYLGGFCADATLDPLWRHFHGTPRVPGPSHLDALAILVELGIEAQVKPVEIPNRKRFATIDEAAGYYREWLLLADDDADVRAQLQRLLPAWLHGRRGAYRSPLRSMPAAIIHWRPTDPR